MTRPDRASKPDLRAVDGRVPGRRGRETREKLLRCTEQLLETMTYRDLKVIDIARCAGTSPATFYQYFPDVEAAIVELGHQLANAGHHLATTIVRGPWKGREAPQTALGLVDAFLGVWEQHRSLLRVVDLATGEGDLRFQNIRTHFLNEVTVALRTVIETFKAQGRHPDDCDPMAQAAALVSLLAHTCAHHFGFEFWGIRFEHVRASVARLVHYGVTGQRPPG